MNTKIALSLAAVVLVPACAVTPSREPDTYQSAFDVAVAVSAGTFIRFEAPRE